MSGGIQQGMAGSFVSRVFTPKGELNLDISTSCKRSFLESCTGVSNTSIKYNLDDGKGKAKLNIHNLFTEINKEISLRNPTKEMKMQWMEQEGVTLPSAEINKMLDTACINMHARISKESKNGIFDSVSSSQSLVLDVNSAQSSIKHTVLNNHSVQDVITKLQKKCETTEEKNLLCNTIVNDITERFYDQHFGQAKLSTVRQQAADAFLSEFNIKQELTPSSFGTVRDSRLSD